MLHLICNELSYSLPFADSQTAERNFRQLLKTFSEGRDLFDFTHIRFHENFPDQNITVTQTFYEWVSSLTNHNLKELLSDLFKKPFRDDLELDEMEKFLESDYTITDENCPTSTQPSGLPIAFVQSVPAISFDTNSFWHKRKIKVNKISNTNEDSDFVVYNVCLSGDFTSPEIEEWAANNYSNRIDTKDLLIRFLNFSKYSVEIQNDFMTQLINWKRNDVLTYRRILELMKDVEHHPFSGGMGQTENLSHLGKESSKYISYHDRLSYSLKNNIVTFIACKGHYEHH